MDILVSYDVNTETREGRRRLRHVAKLCQGYGQRVQLSVFECRVSDAQFEKLRDRLTHVMNKDEDSLRIYRLRQPREEYLEVYGIDRYTNFDDPLVL
jgi:CRISPR-associated protein Cas2